MTNMLNVLIAVVSMLIAVKLVSMFARWRIAKVGQFRSLWMLSEAILSWRSTSSDELFNARHKRMYSVWLLVTPLTYRIVLGKKSVDLLMLDRLDDLKAELAYMRVGAPDLFMVVDTLHTNTIDAIGFVR